LVGFESRELLGWISALVLLALVAWWRGLPREARVCSLLALLFAGTLLEILHRPGAPPELDARPREILIFSGCVVQPPVVFEDREQFVLELARRARVRITLYRREGERPQNLRYGQRIELEARVRRPHNFGNPGSFDYKGYLARRQIYWTAYARPGTSIQYLEGECGNTFWRAVYALRTKALERVEHLYQGKPYETAMLQAMLLGEKSKLEEIWTDLFRRTGTYHALVISGLHLTVLAGVVLFLLRVCSFGEGTVFTVATAFSWLYALVTGFHTPVIRAATGLTIYLAARYFYRRHRLLNLLAAIAIGFLVFDSQQLFEASFQLSFLSVTAIAALAVPLLERTSVRLARGLAGLADRDRDLHVPPPVAQFRIELRLLAETVFLWTRIPERWALYALAIPLRIVFFIYELVVVSAAVQIGLALPMALYFHRVSFSGLSANVAVVPLMSLLVPIGFAVIFTGWSMPALVAGWLLRAIQKVVEWHAQREPLWRIPDPPLWLVISFSGSLILLALAVRGPKRWRWGAITLVAGLFVVLLRHPFPPKVAPGMLEFTAIDVGQGDSLFVAFPDDKLMIVDGGGVPDFRSKKRSRLDIGEDVVSPYLWSRSVRRLDVVAMSHAHEDHMGGLASLIDNFRPRELWTGAVPETPAWQRLREKARQRGVSIRRMSGGQQFHYGGARIEVLTPVDGYSPAAEARDKDSLVIRVSYGIHSVLLTGDMDRQMESELVRQKCLHKTDVLKIAHHGSKTSTFDGFLDVVQPTFAVVSAGFENPYNHPHPDVVGRLKRRRTTLFRTDRWGLISIRTDGHRMAANTALWSGEPRRLLSAF
jgi:competence protein ComEC